MNADPTPPRFDRLTVFAWLWAVWAVTEQAQYDDWAKSAPDLAFSCAALWLLVRPWSLTALAALALTQFVRTAWLMPWVSNHATFASLANLAILLAIAANGATSGSRSIDRERLFEDLAAPIRLGLIALYLWTFFHKLNTGWLDPAGSCGAALYRGMAHTFGLLEGPTAVFALGVIAPLLFELAIPVLLVPRRTRALGVLTLMLFHLTLAAPPITFYRFSSAMFALAFVFWPADTVNVLRRWWEESPWTSGTRAWLGAPVVRSALRVLTIVVVLASTVVLASVTQWTRGIRPLPLYRPLYPPDLSLVAALVGICWAVLAVTIIVVFVLLVRSARSWPSTGAILAVPRPVLWIPVILVVINGALPYLGVKTEASFAMFSNLRTEGGRTNHLLIRRAAHLTSHADELVRIVDSTDRQLAMLGQRGYRMSWFEFRDYVHRRAREQPELDVTFEYAGTTVTLHHREEVMEHLPPVHPVARKLLYYRPVPPDGLPSCDH